MAGTGSRGTFTSVSGHGGTVTVFNSSRNATNGVVTAGTAGGTPYTFSGITKWELTKQAVLTEITHSGSGGWQQRKAIVRGGQFSLEIVWDANTVPDSDVSLDQGDEPVVKLKRGANAGYYRFPAIIESLKITDDQQKDVLRAAIQGFVNGPISNVVSGPTNGA